MQFEYPHYTPFQYAGNKPISYIDLDGLEEAKADKVQPIGDAIVGNNLDGMYNVLGEITAIGAKWDNTKLIATGINIDEDAAASKFSNKKMPQWVKTTQKAASWVKALPYLSDINALVKISNDGAANYFKGKAFDQAMGDATTIMEDEIKNRIKKKTGKAKIHGTINPKLDIKIKGMKVGSIDLVNELAGIIADDLKREVDSIILAERMARLLLIDDYNEFLSESQKFTKDTNIDIYAIYSNKPLLENNGGMLWNKDLNPTYVLRDLLNFADRKEYGGFVPQYISWGFKSGFTNDGFLIQRTLKLNYEGYEILPYGN